MPKREIQVKIKAFAHAAADVSEREIASIHFDVLYCIVTDPPNQHEGEKNIAAGWGWAGGPGVCGSGSCPAGRPDTRGPRR
jgi:hypothetical protein